jgi:hypothetical protein
VQPPQHLVHDAGAVILALLAAVAILSALAIDLGDGERPGDEAVLDSD